LVGSGGGGGGAGLWSKWVVGRAGGRFLGGCGICGGMIGASGAALVTLGSSAGGGGGGGVSCRSGNLGPWQRWVFAILKEVQLSNAFPIISILSDWH